MSSTRSVRLVTVVLAPILAAGAAFMGGPPSAVAKEPVAAKTLAREAKRVDSVPTPKLKWYKCYGHAECDTVSLPRDYDRPSGAKVEVALLRVKARDQKRKIGTLFVNPGGPGGSAVGLAYVAPFIFSAGILNRFDIVGMDPRGTNFSDQVKCFPSARQQTRLFEDLSVPFPYTKAEERSFIRGAKRLGRACSTTGKPLSTAMSTAEVARDMDVVRRAVGDTERGYLGSSYGTYLGQVYANLFPDRFRAIALDGVLDPVAWAGTAATAGQPQTDRIRSADGAIKALLEILVRCDRVGGAQCSFATGDPVANFDLIAERLKRSPIVEVDPATGTEFRFGYADLVVVILGALYSPFGFDEIVSILSELIVITEPPAAVAVASTKTAPSAQAKALRRLQRSLAKAEQRAERIERRQPSYGFPYDNSLEAFAAVMCTDSVNPRHASAWPAAAAAADRRAKYFGRAWAWQSAWCASRTWTAKDEDAYRGPFNRATAAPVLVVGNLWDPATNYAGAVKAASLLPNSRLLSSDSWGHTAYGSSDCVNNAMEAYLLNQTLPAAGARCVGDIQPFETELEPPEESLQLLLRATSPVAGPANR